MKQKRTREIVCKPMFPSPRLLCSLVRNAEHDGDIYYIKVPKKDNELFVGQVRLAESFYLRTTTEEGVERDHTHFKWVGSATRDNIDYVAHKVIVTRIGKKILGYLYKHGLTMELNTEMKLRY